MVDLIKASGSFSKAAHYRSTRDTMTRPLSIFNSQVVGDLGKINEGGEGHRKVGGERYKLSYKRLSSGGLSSCSRLSDY